MKSGGGINVVDPPGWLRRAWTVAWKIGLGVGVFVIFLDAAAGLLAGGATEFTGAIGLGGGEAATDPLTACVSGIVDSNQRWSDEIKDCLDAHKRVIELEGVVADKNHEIELLRSENSSVATSSHDWEQQAVELQNELDAVCGRLKAMGVVLQDPSTGELLCSAESNQEVSNVPKQPEG